MRLARDALLEDQLSLTFASFEKGFLRYICRAASAAMAINGARNKRPGPGGGTRRLHHSPSAFAEDFGGAEIASTDV